MRYEVTIQHYRLDAGHVGEPLRYPVVWSRHRSFRAAGRVLAHIIHSRMKELEVRGEGLKLVILDTETGDEFSRTGRKV